MLSLLQTIICAFALWVIRIVEFFMDNFIRNKRRFQLSIPSYNNVERRWIELGMPIIPCKTQPEAFTDILESIALEETGLAHILNAEGEKIQAIVKLLEAREVTPRKVIEFQKSVGKL